MQKKIINIKTIKIENGVYFSEGIETLDDITTYRIGESITVFVSGKSNAKKSNDFVFVDPKRNIVAVVDGVGESEETKKIGKAFLKALKKAIESEDSWRKVPEEWESYVLKSIKKCKKDMIDNAEQDKWEKKYGSIVFKVVYFNKETRKGFVVGNGDVEVVLVSSSGIGMPLEPESDNGIGISSEEYGKKSIEYLGNNIISNSWKVIKNKRSESIENSTEEEWHFELQNTQDETTQARYIVVMSDGVAEQLWVEDISENLTHFRYNELKLVQTEAGFSRLVEKLRQKQKIATDLLDMIDGNHDFYKNITGSDEEKVLKFKTYEETLCESVNKIISKMENLGLLPKGEDSSIGNRIYLRFIMALKAEVAGEKELDVFLESLSASEGVAKIKEILNETLEYSSLFSLPQKEQVTEEILSMEACLLILSAINNVCLSKKEIELGRKVEEVKKVMTEYNSLSEEEKTNLKQRIIKNLKKIQTEYAIQMLMKSLRVKEDDMGMVVWEI